MKKTFIFSVMATLLLVVNVMKMNAQNPCDLSFDFELGNQFAGSNNLAVTRITNPYKTGINATSDYVLQVTVSGAWNVNGVAFLIELPEGKKFSEVYSQIKFQVAASSTLSGKDTYIVASSIASNWTNTSPNWYYQSQLSSTSISTTWSERTVSVSALNANIQNRIGTFYLGVGVRTENATVYYMDNLVLEAAPGYICVNPVEDATLSALTVTPQGTLTPAPLTPAFASGTFAYAVNVASDVKSVTIGATASQSSAVVSGDTGAKNLNFGANAFTVHVDAEDGVHEQDYTITVIRYRADFVCNTEFDFENGVINTTTYTGVNLVGGVATVVANPIPTGNSSAKALKFAVNNYTAGVFFSVKAGKLSDNYSRIEFDVATGESSNQGGKGIVFGISSNGTTYAASQTISVNSADLAPGSDGNIYNAKWRRLSIDVSKLSTIKDNTTTLHLGLGINDNGNRIYYFDNIKLIGKDGTCHIAYIWNGSAGTSAWGTAANWTPNGVPTAIDEVIILPNVSVYPAVPANTEIETITFAPGAEIANQHNLKSGYKSYVQYDFSSPDARDRWHMISTPFQEAYVGDYTFGGHPRTFFQPFGANGWEVSNTFSNDKMLTAGDSFLFWIENSTYDAGSGKGLGSATGKLEIPFFAQDDALDTGVHPNHEYDGSSESTFYNYKWDGSAYVNGSTALTASRSDAAYKLAGAMVYEPLVFAHDDEYNSDFALVGNPFMSTIDFDALYTDNGSAIKPNYQIWTGKGGSAGFAGYTTNGYFGTISDTEISSVDKYIAPLQSFFVEKNLGAINLEFDITSVTASATGKGILRNAENKHNRLEIIASNPTASVLAFVADRETGQNVAGLEDAAKLFVEASEIPEVYTLKETTNGTLAALGANIIHSDNSLIPIGLFTTHNGSMSLLFKGMNDYDAHITLIDHAEGDREIDLTDLPFYQYDFDFTPVLEGGKYLPVNNRISIQLAPKIPTGLDIFYSDVKVYLKNKRIYVLAGLNKIQQVAIYNVQGALLQFDNSLNTSSVTMDCSANLPAVYIVKVVTNQGVKNFKVINN